MKYPTEMHKIYVAHQRRLLKLKEKEANFGLSAPPEVLTEIEDIEQKLAELEPQLAVYRAPKQSQNSAAPVLHLHNWGRKPGMARPGVIFRDWQQPGLFEEREDGTRTVPSPEDWTQTLLPDLRALRQQIPGDVLHLEGRCALSSGFALGQIFPAKDQYQLEVAQFVPTRGVEYWFSRIEEVAPSQLPEFTSYRFAGAAQPDRTGPLAQDGVVVINSITGKTTPDVLENVGQYLGEAELFRELLQGEAKPKTVAGVLVLEVESVVQAGLQLEGWEALLLAYGSRQKVQSFCNQLKPAKLHLFLATPLGLAVFLGYFWNKLGLVARCYEETRKDRFYEPSCEFRLN